MMLEIPEFATTEEKLLQLTDALETIKNMIGNLLDDMDEDSEVTESLEDAMEAVDDAIDSLGDAVDELEEEELDLDEANDEEF